MLGCNVGGPKCVNLQSVNSLLPASKLTAQLPNHVQGASSTVIVCGGEWGIIFDNPAASSSSARRAPPRRRGVCLLCEHVSCVPVCPCAVWVPYNQL